MIQNVENPGGTLSKKQHCIESVEREQEGWRKELVFCRIARDALKHDSNCLGLGAVADDAESVGTGKAALIASVEEVNDARRLL